MHKVHITISFAFLKCNFVCKHLNGYSRSTKILYSIEELKIESNLHISKSHFDGNHLKYAAYIVAICLKQQYK